MANAVEKPKTSNSVQNSSTSKAVDDARSALEQLQARLQNIKQRERYAQERLSNAADDVDQHVEATLEIQGCQAAAKHLNGQIEETQSRLKLAQEKEDERQATTLRSELEKHMEDVLEQIAAVYEMANSEEVTGTIKAHERVCGPFESIRRRHEEILSPLRKILSDSGKYTLSAGPQGGFKRKR